MLTKNISLDIIALNDSSRFRQELIERLNHDYSVQIAGYLHSTCSNDKDSLFRIVNMLTTFLDDEIYNTKVIHVFLYLLQKVVLEGSDMRSAEVMLQHFLNHIYSSYQLHTREQNELLSDLEFNADFLWYQQSAFLWLMFARVSEDRYIYWASMSSEEKAAERNKMNTDDYYQQLYCK